MSEAPHKPTTMPESVRTPADGLVVVSLCPICRVTMLRGRQTACSPACRRERSRRRQEVALLARIARIAEELQALRQAVQRTH